MISNSAWFAFLKMAEVSAVQSDPNFAIVCSFIDRHGSLLNLPDISFEALQRCIDETRFSEF